jgi:hypothetical protein
MPSVISIMVSSLGQLVKDRTTWIGGVSSTLASISVKDGFFPQTLEAWGALTLTGCTIIYIVTKCVILIRGQIKKVAASEDV